MVVLLSLGSESGRRCIINVEAAILHLIIACQLVSVSLRAAKLEYRFLLLPRDPDANIRPTASQPNFDSSILPAIGPTEFAWAYALLIKGSSVSTYQTSGLLPIIP
jgi:hypothetical protein